MLKIIGRESEKQKLNRILDSKESEFVAVYGRRRVGKTYLIRSFFENKKCVFFHVSGILKAKQAVQLNAFKQAVLDTFYTGLTGTNLETPKDWMSALAMLTDAIKTFASRKKVILFFDEFPWMAARKKQLLEAVDHYWNRYWSAMNNIRLIICGSAASWIIKHILNNKGGLHNRVTLKLLIEPFNLQDTSAYLKSRGLRYNQSQILQLYMCLGGIPHYLRLAEAGFSAMQNVNQLCFQKTGGLFEEFDNLFSSLFEQSEKHEAIIKLLASKREGMGRDEIEKALDYKGGDLSTWLKELEHAGFINSFRPWGRERGIFYKIIDEYTLFYLTWIAPDKKSLIQKEVGHAYWESLSQTPGFKSWAGFAFEALCFKHLSGIRSALSIPEGSAAFSWRYRAKHEGENGAQIDLLFDRPDGVITVCEIKYASDKFKIDKELVNNLINKITIYKKITQTEKQIFISMITSFGLAESMYKENLIDSEARLEDLFQ